MTKPRSAILAAPLAVLQLLSAVPAEASSGMCRRDRAIAFTPAQDVLPGSASLLDRAAADLQDGPSRYPIGVPALPPGVDGISTAERARRVNEAEARLREKFRQAGLELGTPLYFRAVKYPGLARTIADAKAKGKASEARCFADPDRCQHFPYYRSEDESVLEVWAKRPDGTYVKFHTYTATGNNGRPGPKQNQGDNQVPEGFYGIDPRPESAARAAGNGYLPGGTKWFLALDVGFPNQVDRSYGRSGSLIRLHGTVKDGYKLVETNGCLSFFNEEIEEIYAMARAAGRNGHQTPIHIFPFEMTEENLAAMPADHPSQKFWREQLMPGWEAFGDGSNGPPRVQSVPDPAKPGRLRYRLAR